MRTDETKPGDWLFLAKERLVAADVLRVALGATYSGIELLQESVERYLKGYLISRGWALRKTHSLPALLDEAIALDDRFMPHADVCENLAAQFWAQHYPGDDLSDVGLDYDELRKKIGDLVTLIQTCVKG